MADLVIANAPFQTYPGGVIVLRAKDWMGSARGTLSSETDSRACSGFAVRDSQKVTADANIQDAGSYGAAADTLTIDLSGLPIETNPVRYVVAVSFLIEGDWNPTDLLTTANMNQYQLDKCATVAWTFGAGAFSSSLDLDYIPRNIPHYSISSGATASLLTGTEIMHFKAFSFTGTTVEWLIDQIYMIPESFGGTPWDNDDFRYINADHPSVSLRESFDLWIDGADGGDDFGKFTLHPFSFITQSQWGFGSGSGGDYQRKASAGSAEYSFDVIGSENILGNDESDGYFIWDSEAQAEAKVQGYGIHGPHLVPSIVWVDDDFSRTIGDNNFAGADNHFVSDGGWGSTSEGFFWNPEQQFGPVTTSGLREGRAIFVDGNRGSFHVRRAPSFTNSGGVLCNLMPSSSGAGIAADNLSFSGKFRVDLIAEELVSGTPESGDDHDVATVFLGFEEATGNSRPRYQMTFAHRTGEWKLEDHQNQEDIIGESPLVDWTDISSWWTGSAEVGFRLEVYRYLLRARVWDASGAEPSTWDYEGFRNLNLSPNFPDYPYAPLDTTDIRRIWAAENERFTAYCGMGTGVIIGSGIEEMAVSYDDIKIEHDCDNGGSNTDVADTHYSVERPKGTVVDNVTVPAGAQQMVYWGKRDWTDIWDSVPSYLGFAAKAWNPTNAPMMQRAETIVWYFRSVHGSEIAPIFWHPYKKKVAERKFPV